MNFLDKVIDLWQGFLVKATPVYEQITDFFHEFGKAFMVVWNHICRLRKVIAAIPVAMLAVYLAIYNLANLPTVVGLGLQNSGEFAVQVSKEIAVLGPIALTATCLLLMFASRRTLTPWVVSLCSLLLPLLIYLTNVIPV